MSSSMPPNPMSSAVANPYSPPQAVVEDLMATSDETYEPKFFSTSGRIGRVRYLAYGMGNYLLFVVSLMVLGGVLSAIVGSSAFFFVVVPGYIAFFVAQLILVRRRCHDLDWSGWLALLMFVPLVNLVFLLLPGTKGVNDYGPPPSPNGKLAPVVIILFVGICAIGILAAIAIPQYQSYVERARAANGSAR